MTKISISECPRDAMQGLTKIIATKDKIKLLNAIGRVGFPVIDGVSFVSPKAIPQMGDSADVIKGLDPGFPDECLLAIVANERGAKDAVAFDKIRYLGFPLSVSETFQQRNTNKSISAAKETLAKISQLSAKTGKKLVVYISMAFGNPYQEPFSFDEVLTMAKELSQIGVYKVALSDTIGSASPDDIKTMFTLAKQQVKEIEIGLHLHSRPEDVISKAIAGLEAGCTSFDSALLGLGGCPMAKDDLVGNMDTELVAEAIDQKRYKHGLDLKALKYASNLARDLLF